jgi:hypothetical protein
MTSRSGGLLELVARGKKDTFFTSNPVVSFFHSVYLRAAPFTKEIYVSKPRNVPEWGRWVEFELEHRGDLAKNFYLHIELPTWLPSEAVAANATGVVTDASGVTFGYCNNVGFQVLDRIQVFQDQVLLHELYGEYLDWRLRQYNDIATTYVLSSEVGSRPETALALGRSASGGMLRVPLPLLGWQHLHDPGFPSVALRSQRFRLRILLRRLEDVVVASDGRLNPQPWGGKTLHIQATRDGLVDTSQVTLRRDAMRTIGLSLESTQIYVPGDVQLYLKSQVIRMPFIHAQWQQFTIEDNQMTAAAVTGFGTFSLPLALDFIGPVDRLLVGFRSAAATLAGQRTALIPAARTARLNIANIDRIKEWPMSLFRDVSAYWKNRRAALDLADPDVLQNVYTLTFGGYDNGTPAGTLSFTRAVLPTLYLTLAALPYDRRNTSRQCFAVVYAESWNVFEIGGGRGKMMFDDS